MNHLNRQEHTGAGLAAGSVLLIGGSVAASSLLGGYPVLGWKEQVMPDPIRNVVLVHGPFVDGSMSSEPVSRFIAEWR